MGIYALMKDSRGNIWIGTKGQGIFVLQNLKTALKKKQFGAVKITRLVHESGNANSLAGNDIYDLYEDQLGGVIGQFGGG